MQKMVPFTLMLASLLCAACNTSDQKQTPVAPPEAAVPAPVPAANSAAALVADPRVGDVYVIRFQPQGTPDTRYFFYHLFRVTPDSAYLHPARKPATDAAADLTQPDFQASANSIGYSRRELAELLQPQAGDVLKTQLVQVRRGQ